MALRVSGTRFGPNALTKRKKWLSAGGWPVSKWIEFCEEMHALGLETHVHAAQTTRSKYVHVCDRARSKIFKVRFSNHRPNYLIEATKDSDFYVGVTNFGCTTTLQAIEAVRNHFGIKS